MARDPQDALHDVGVGHHSGRGVRGPGPRGRSPARGDVEAGRETRTVPRTHALVTDPPGHSLHPPHVRQARGAGCRAFVQVAEEGALLALSRHDLAAVPGLLPPQLWQALVEQYHVFQVG
jgi:hypothetical protein